MKCNKCIDSHHLQALERRPCLDCGRSIDSYIFAPLYCKDCAEKRNICEQCGKGLSEVESLRKVEVLVNGDWVNVRMMELHKGDLIRLTEPDGTMLGHKGNYVFKCAGEPFLSENGIAGVQADFYQGGD